MSVEELINLLEAMCDELSAHRDAFCLLDSGIGDGDHGVSIERGFTAAKGALAGTKSAADVFSQMSKALSQTMGGAIGPIYGAFYQGLADACESGLSATAYADGLARGAANVARIAMVKEGQKTVFDAMAHAARAASECTHKSLKEVAKAAALAGRAGSDGTRDMMATKGRAKFLREKSIGHVDAGSASFAKMLEIIAELIR